MMHVIDRLLDEVERLNSEVEWLKVYTRLDADGTPRPIRSIIAERDELKAACPDFYSEMCRRREVK